MSEITDLMSRCEKREKDIDMLVSLLSGLAIEVDGVDSWMDAHPDIRNVFLEYVFEPPFSESRR